MTPRMTYIESVDKLNNGGGSLIRINHPNFRFPTKRKDVLFTVPHGAPGNDALAPQAGLAAYENCQLFGVDADIVMSVCCRYTIVDQNRPQSRGSDFRTAIRRKILEEKPQFLVDVHSFTNLYKSWSPYDIILLHTPGLTDVNFLRRYASELEAAAKQLGRRCKTNVQLERPGIVHDILVEAHELGMKSNRIMLVEHNEAWSPALAGALHARALSREIGLIGG